MKLVRKHTAYLVFLFLLPIIFQSCLIYKKPPIQLSEASNTSIYYYKKVKTFDGRVFHLRTLQIKSNQVYGSTTKKGELKKLGFSVDEIESIRLQNIELSGVGNGVMVVGLFSIILFLWYQNEMKDFDCCGIW